MLPQEVILKKRRGGVLTEAEIGGFIRGLTAGTVKNEQASALAMAICFQGMEDAERALLTLAMRDSGAVMSWDLPGPVVDKHSTGGVGDNVSLMLAPALAACGVFVPMISGRGLGHTGGTLDKLSAIPGYDAAPSPEAFEKIVREVGCAIIGQTGDLAPADKKLYAIRDVTGTVESVDLITASILSKKLAAGLDALVMDVKVGTGAFMDTPADAERLARSLVATANNAGCACSALITDMNEPLAPAAGNSLEVSLACRFLTMVDVDPRLWDVTVALGGELLALCGAVSGAEEGRMRIARAFESGRAAEVFGRMVTALGGPSDFMERFEDYAPRAPVVRDLEVAAEGVVTGIDARALGNAVVELGGGRTAPEDAIDLSVGLSGIAALGSVVSPGDPLCTIHAKDEAAWDRAAARVRAAYGFGERAPLIPEPVLRRIGPEDV